MTEDINEIRKIIMYEVWGDLTCNCELASTHHPTLGWLCGLTRSKTTPQKTCWEMCGTEECKKHAYRRIQVTTHKVDPIFTEFEDENVKDYVTVSR